MVIYKCGCNCVTLSRKSPYYFKEAIRKRVAFLFGIRKHFFNFKLEALRKWKKNE